MSEEDMDFYTLSKEEVLSQDGTSYNIYKELDKNLESGSAESVEKVDIKYCANLFNSNGAKSDEHKLCEKFERNLRKISKMEDYGTRKDKCLHFIYWIYAEARKIINKSNSNFTSANFISKFRDVQNKIYKENNIKYYCKIYFDSTLDKWREQKVLHDYFRNYDKIKLKDSSNGGKCQKYNRYIDFIRKIYKEHAQKEKCCENYNIHYWNNCDYFKCHDIYNPNKIILKMNCDNKQARDDPEVERLAKSIKKVDSNIFLLENSMIVKPAKCVKTYNATTKDHEGYSCLLPEYSEQNTSSSDSSKRVNLGKHISVIDMSSYKNVSEIKIQDNNNQYNYDRATSEIMTLFTEVPQAVRREYRKRKYLECSYEKNGNGKTVLCKIPDNPIKGEPERIPIITTVKGSVYESDLAKEGNVLDNNYTRIAVVFILALAALLIFFIYYKYTPVGSWIRNRRRGKKKVEETYIKRKQSSPYREFEHKEVPIQRERIRIAYQTT